MVVLFFWNFPFSHWKLLGNGVRYISDLSLPWEIKKGKLGIYPLVIVSHWLRTVLEASSPQLFQPFPQAESDACSRTSSPGTGKWALGWSGQGIKPHTKVSKWMAAKRKHGQRLKTLIFFFFLAICLQSQTFFPKQKVNITLLLGKLKMYPLSWKKLVAQMVKNLLALQETPVRSLGWEDPLEEGVATHSSILAWRISMDRQSWWATVQGVTRSLWLSTHTHT